jgi:hypothetical protein
MNPSPVDLAPRYAPGEDAGPLLRALVGGLVGASAALALDWLLPVTGLPRLVWPALWSEAVGGTFGDTGLGVAAVLTLGVLAALVYAYGQFRRFVPAVPALAGVAWGVLLWLLAAPLLLPGAAGWLASAGAPEPGLALTAGVGLVAETLVGMAVYGAIVGVTNPPRR